MMIIMIADTIEIFYGSAYGSGTGQALITCQDNPQNPEFVPIGSCSSNTASNLTCTDDRNVGLRCSTGQCRFCLMY